MAATLPLTGDGDISQNSTTPANGKYKLTNSTSGAGKTLTIEGSNAAAGNYAGGVISLLPGAKTGTGTQGYVLVKGPAFAAAGDQANLSLGDSNHSIRAEYGFGMKISTAGAQNAIVIQENTGYVGIGTTSPVKKLHVAGGSGSDMGVDTNGKIYFDLNETTKDTYFTYDGLSVKLVKNGSAVATW